MTWQPPAAPLIMIPAYNEASVIGVTLHELRAEHPDWPVVVIDDGSSDGTARIAREHGAHVLRHAVNQGVGAARRTGFAFAVRHGYSTVVQIDADGQHDPRDVERLLAAAHDADVVVGARFAASEDYHVPAMRRATMRLLAAMINRWCGYTLTDTTSGFRVFGPRALATYAANYPAEYLGDTVEALMIAHRAGLSVTQVSVRMRPRQGGVPSQPTHRAALYTAQALLVLMLAKIRKRPSAPPRVDNDLSPSVHVDVLRLPPQRVAAHRVGAARGGGGTT